MNPKDIQGMKKPQLHLIPPRVLREVARVMEHGASKYGAYNWREQEIQASQYISANGRHTGTWWEGEDIDPDSGLNHIYHAIATLIILADTIVGENLIDDRPNGNISST